MLRPTPLILALAACGERQVYDERIPVDDAFDRAEPSAEALARYRAAAEFSAETGGRAVLVLEGDAVVFEEGQNGHGLDEPAEIFSGTKSFACGMALAAREDGLLDLDAPASETLEEWRGDAEKERIRVSDLLHFTSGLDDDRFHLTWDGLLVEQRVEDKYAFAVGMEVADEPGATYRYKSADLMVFGEVLSRRTGQDPLAWFEARVLDRIGFRYSGWNRDPAGNAMLPYGAWTTANEWAKYGALVRDDGVWKGDPVLAVGAFADCFAGTEAMPAYGLTFWLNAELTEAQAALVPGRIAEEGRLLPEAPADLVMAAGAHDNRMYVIPSLDLVVVRLGDGRRGWDDHEFLARLLAD